ncbi:CAAX protease self-immunity [Aquimarina amphilecti]|uniref:CAAX protease self-immunity n=1 Tax=Aquimarina amphilecti TaxID=1038014 RepID=A0A1H7MBP1_AQUAM|nr:CPBP family intramembrane glutamic endopeptidase [Aquimarina amphilecti]SEL08603.1 CAAX protease self-immunity [Aquimarina amphilecti]
MIIAALLLLIASAIEYKKDFFTSLGFQRKRINIKSLLIIAPLLAIIIFLFNGYVLMPIITYLTEQSIDYSEFERYKGNLPVILTFLVFVWLSAAFAEEIVFRGYLMKQFTKKDKGKICKFDLVIIQNLVLIISYKPLLR